MGGRLGYFLLALYDIAVYAMSTDQLDLRPMAYHAFNLRRCVLTAGAPLTVTLPQRSIYFALMENEQLLLLDSPSPSQTDKSRQPPFFIALIIYLFFVYFRYASVTVNNDYQVSIQ